MIQLPNDTAGRTYANLHFEFFTKYLELSGHPFEYINSNNEVWFNRKSTCISITIDKKQVVFDYADHTSFEMNDDYSIPYFKFHYADDVSYDTNIFPLGPLIISPCDGKDLFTTYLNLRKEVNYNPYTSKKVQCRQKPYGNARGRRILVREILHKNYMEHFDGRNQKQLQVDFWYSQTSCLTSICVPGQREDILDRSQWELMGLGTCTISTRLSTVLPHFEDIWPGQHYLECKPDFSDLIEKVEWIRENPKQAKEIGNYAKELFDTLYTPHKYWEWILNKTRNFYE